MMGCPLECRLPNVASLARKYGLTSLAPQLPEAYGDNSIVGG